MSNVPLSVLVARLENTLETVRLYATAYGTDQAFVKELRQAQDELRQIREAL